MAVARVMIKRIKPEYAAIRIIPHQSVLNSNARRFQHAIYELFSVKEPRIKREGFRIAIRPAPSFWWITKMYTDDSGRHIEYYCAMPTEFTDAFRTKFRNHEQWRKCTLIDFDAAEFTFPDVDNTDLYALKYKRHDMFSLDFDYAEQASPVRDILGVTNELSAGESVDIFVCTEPMSRKQWKKVVDYAFEQWDKGGIPYRAGFDPMRTFRDIAYGAAHVVFEVKSLLDDLLGGIERTFMHKSGEVAVKRERPKFTNPERAEILVNGDVSKRTKNKRNLPVFKTSIRYAVKSEDTVRRGMFARSVANAYADLNGDNRLEMIRVNIRPKEALNDLRNWRINEQTPNIMSVDEIGKLTQLPTAELQAEFKDALESNQRVEIELPRVFLDDSGILCGTATDRGTVHNVHIPTKDRDFLFTPRIVCGSPRMGKDQHVINLVVEAKRKHGIGAVIPDVIDERNGHRGMADALRDHLPPDDVIDIDLGDTEHPVYLGLESITREIKDARLAADRISEEITAFLLEDSADDKIQTADYLREAAKAVNGDILGIKQMFTSAAFRKRKIAELDDKFDMDIWRDYDKMSDGMQAMKYGPVMRRIGQIMNSEFLRPIFCQAPNPAMDLSKWIREGKVVIFRIPGKDISERVKEILVYWIVLNVFLIKLAHGGQGPGTFLVLNEPHQFLSAGLVHFMERMLAEGPKYRVAPVIIFHHFAQFKRYPAFVDTMMAASANWHVFKNTNNGVYDRLMPYLSGTFADAQQAFEATKRFQYIAVWLNANGEYEVPFVADSLPMVGDRYETQDNSFLTLRHSRQYGRPIAEVLAEIKRRNKIG
jgi:hypothetical protein